MQALTNLISLSLHQSIETPFRLFIELKQYLLTNRDIGKYISNSQEDDEIIREPCTTVAQVERALCPEGCIKAKSRK